MAKITWDSTGSRFYETGVSKGVLYVQESDGTYDTGIPWNGLTSISESPDGAEPSDLWADNIKYATLISTETFNATIEAYTYPEEFNVCDGNFSPDDLTGLYIGQQSRKAFGLCYRTEVGNDTTQPGGDLYKLHIVYNCTAAPSDKSYETINDSPDAQTLSWEIRTNPVDTGIDGVKPTATLTIDTSKLDNTAKGNLSKLEAMLYGVDADAEHSIAASDPTLPTPAQVISLLKTGSI